MDRTYDPPALAAHGIGNFGGGDEFDMANAGAISAKKIKPSKARRDFILILMG
jgi:hypothetical protein